ncbi:PDGLE domain-containing protein [Rhodococcus sp. CC-R104]|uniref:PDGLE domain-containing protein n=2 Tax=Rhodococcus chondri TaxID=3065941 RepID=A0ABU7JP32_9NOCA|nr:PDGLE domain-containing protein [Rhodococcus sp. CC-R104]
MGALGFATLIVAGALAPLASSSPDALDAATRRGCESATETRTGDCMARNVREHRLADGALAGYTVGERDESAWVAGLIGAALTFVTAGVSFRVLVRPGATTRRERVPAPEPPSQPPF